MQRKPDFRRISKSKMNPVKMQAKNYTGFFKASINICISLAQIISVDFYDNTEKVMLKYWTLNNNVISMTYVMGKFNC